MTTRKKVPADVAALKSIVQEQSVKIAELEQQKVNWQAVASREASIARKSETSVQGLAAQLTAEQQAHAGTKRQLEEVDRALLAIDRILEPTLRASYVVWSYDIHKAWNDAKAREAARQASINHPTDKQPTDDRGEGEK